MIRAMTRALTIAALVTAAPALAETAQERQQRCGIQTGIVQQAVTLRAGRKSQKGATRRILRSEAIAGTKYERNVDILVQWVYGLPQDQLTDNTVTTFEAACNDYKQ